MIQQNQLKERYSDYIESLNLDFHRKNIINDTQQVLVLDNFTEQPKPANYHLMATSTCETNNIKYQYGKLPTNEILSTFITFNSISIYI